MNSKSKYLLFKETQTTYIIDNVCCDTLVTLLDLSDIHVIDNERVDRVGACHCLLKGYRFSYRSE